MASRKKGQIPPKRLAWANAYLANGFDGVEAARTARYSERRLKQAAYEVMHDPLVKAYLDERMKVMQMSADEAMTRLAGHGRGNIKEFIGLSQDEIKTHPDAWLIKKYKFKTRRIASGVIEEYSEIEIHDPQTALNSILKQLQLASGQPTEILGMLPALERFIELAQGAGKDPKQVIERMATRLASERKME